jgi:hypothetical protein
MQKPNWREWKHTPDVTVWQACALSLDINPRRLVPDTRLIDRYPTKGPFFLPQNFASKEVEEEFDLRQRLLLVNLPNYTFFPTRYRDRWEGSRREGNSLVRLPEFASWAVSVVMWEGMPPELIELAIALPRTELSPPTIPPPPISDRQTLLRQRKSVTIAEAAEILTGIAGWTKQNRAAMDLIREAIQDDELEPESVHYFDEDASTFDASRAVIDQGATTVTAANFDAWRARTFQSTESAQATDAPPQVTDEVQEQSEIACSGTSEKAAPEVMTDDGKQPDTHADTAALFDPVKVVTLEALFPDGGKWANYAARATRNGLLVAKIGRGTFNPYRAALWWIERGHTDWKPERCLRVLANNLPVRSRDSKHLLTGEFD